MKVTWSLLFIVAQGEKSHWVGSACFKVFIQSFFFFWIAIFLSGGRREVHEAYKTEKARNATRLIISSSNVAQTMTVMKKMEDLASLDVCSSLETFQMWLIGCPEQQCSPGSCQNLEAGFNSRLTILESLSQCFTDVKKHHDCGKSLLKCI